MPKAPMTAAEIERMRQRILETALDIIVQEGFNNLSIRKIAARLGVTATTIYNYYANKDELNLMIRVRGFQMLYAMMTAPDIPAEPVEDRLRAMIAAYIQFGLRYPSYYDIMFNLHTPKYLDYVGTDMEPTASDEKQNALKCLALFVDLIRDYIVGNSSRKEAFVLYQVVRFWSDMHGFITLYNSRLFHEVLGDVEEFIKARTSDLMDDIFDLKQRVDAGLLAYL